MLKLRPPTHRIDAAGVFVSVHDPAWDDDLYTADMEALFSAALTAAQDAAEAAHRTKHPDATAEDIEALRAACELSDEAKAAARGRHPVVRYATGQTRYQLDAPDRDPEGKPCTVRSRYLTHGQACELTIRRLSFAAYQAADEVTSSNARLTAFARAGLRAIASPDWNWQAKDGEQRAPDEVIQALHDSSPDLLIELGLAVIGLCRPLSVTETFR